MMASRLEMLVKKIVDGSLTPDEITNEELVEVQDLVMTAVVNKMAQSNAMAFGSYDSVMVC